MDVGVCCYVDRPPSVAPRWPLGAGLTFGVTMFDKYILNRLGEPVVCSDLLEWGQWMQGEGRTLARTELPRVTVSTVFLGLDHRMGAEGPPVLWETMIFTQDGSTADGLNEEQWRYTNREDALAGHSRAVALLGAN